MVINEQGKATDIRVKRPLGLGFEEASQAAMNTWTFAPGTRFGEPVKVKLNVEMQFRLD
jgi:periplasmic protein TonB